MNKYEKIINNFGLVNQVHKLLEEVDELKVEAETYLKALKNGINDIETLEKIMYEAVDVLVLVNQLKVFNKLDKNIIEDHMEFKVDRTLEIINVMNKENKSYEEVRKTYENS